MPPESANNRTFHATQLNPKWLALSVFVYVTLVFNLLEPFDMGAPYFMPIYHFMLSTYGMLSGAVIWGVSFLFLDRYANSIGATETTSKLSWIVLLVVLLSIASWLYSLLLHQFISGWQNMYVPEYKFSQLMPKFLAIYSVWGGLSLLQILMIKTPQSQSEQNPPSPKDMLLQLHSDNQLDRFRVAGERLVCFQTCDNYLQIYYLDEKQQLKTRLIRSSMKKMIEQLQHCDFTFFRTHQSFLVNTSFIKGVNKRPNLLSVEVAYLDFDVALSRKNVKPLLELIAA
ncbi:MAG: hypothetical protein GJ680_05735 [Alteromonadaceae bacterium]|nr:hypothetical protein [Alteromonadaceae bacterium]